jgi:hypothetical protein
LSARFIITPHQPAKEKCAVQFGILKVHMSWGGEILDKQMFAYVIKERRKIGEERRVLHPSSHSAAVR